MKVAPTSIAFQTTAQVNLTKGKSSIAISDAEFIKYATVPLDMQDGRIITKDPGVRTQSTAARIHMGGLSTPFIAFDGEDAKTGKPLDVIVHQLGMTVYHKEAEPGKKPLSFDMTKEAMQKALSTIQRQQKRKPRSPVTID